MFWFVAALVLALCIAVLLAGLLRARPAPPSPDAGVYRAQLAELERDAARGTLAPEEAGAARAEVARRLLAADRAEVAAARLSRPRLAVAVAALLVPAVALPTYAWLGVPSYPDLPLAERRATIERMRATRPDQATAEAEIPDSVIESNPEATGLAEQLRAVLVDRPDDLRGWRLAVQTETGLNNLKAAWRAQDRVVALLGAEAPGSEFALLAELMILAAGGYVSPEAERALAEALRRDPAEGSARYYSGLMYAQGGRPDLAWPIWRRLLSDSAPDAPWVEPILAQIETVSVLAGEPTAAADLPRGRGPTAEDVEAVSDLAPADRMAMIEGMVSNLAVRLADEGGPAQDWARLITAYGVLDRPDAAAPVYAEAKIVFADDPEALVLLAQAAEQAGIQP